MYVIKEDSMRIPAKIWSAPGSIEEGALQQIKNASALPFAFHHTVVCPDGHIGYGAPIGGILATYSNYIVVNFVGVDIGCGMHAMKTNLEAGLLDITSLKKIMGEIRKAIPVGFNHRSEALKELMPAPGGNIGVVVSEWSSAEHQIGTLGGGNHFIEFQKDQYGFLWIMIHSGSRNLGKKVADEYNKKAKLFNERYFSSVPKEWDLAFLSLDDAEGQAYVSEMEYCVKFARANRGKMMEDIRAILTDNISSITFEPAIDIAHNYASLEHHFGSNVWVHRKGATRAYQDEIGVIPGSQGTKSYIVRGLGNPESFMSCSHGAGRCLGRKAAKRTLDLAKEIKALDDLGIVHSLREVNDLDEAPGAYKDVELVMKNQEDLVTIVTKLTPLAVIKAS